MAGHPQGHGHGRTHNGIDRFGNVGTKNGRPIEFLVAPVGGLPHLAEGALFGEDNLGIKHGVEVVVVVAVGSVVVVVAGRHGVNGKMVDWKMGNAVRTIIRSMPTIR